MKDIRQVVFVVATIALSIALLDAQEKKPEKADPPKLADVLRENEALKRDNDVLKRTLRDRDARLQLATFEREGMVKAVIADPNDPDGSKTVQARCSTLEAQLRAVEKPDDKSAFDCSTLTFTKKE